MSSKGLPSPSVDLSCLGQCKGYTPRSGGLPHQYWDPKLSTRWSSMSHQQPMLKEIDSGKANLKKRSNVFIFSMFNSEVLAVILVGPTCSFSLSHGFSDTHAFHYFYINYSHLLFIVIIILNCISLYTYVTCHTKMMQLSHTT